MQVVLVICAIIIGVLCLGYSALPTIIYRSANLCRKKQKKKVLYLTFDDGPSEYTNELLDLLLYHQIHATFFVVAEFAQQFPDSLLRMQQEGHQVALHCRQHKNALWMGPMRTKEEFRKSIKIMDAMGIKVTQFRPPWGIVNGMLLMQIQQYKLQLRFWDVMAEDWEGDTTAEQIYEKLLRRTKSGSVICLHDGRGTNRAPSRTIQALRQILPQWRQMGYQFLTMEECSEK